MSPYELSNSRNRLNKSLGVFFSRHIFARCQIKKPCVICLNSLSLHLSISDRSILCKYNPSVLSAMADPCFIGRIRGKKVIVCMDLQEPCEMPNPDLCCSQWLNKERTIGLSRARSTKMGGRSSGFSASGRFIPDSLFNLPSLTPIIFSQCIH